MSDSQTIERVLINIENGKLGVGIRVRFMDKYHQQDVSAFDSKYKVYVEPTEPDAWAVDNEDGVWFVIANGDLIKQIEDLGPL